MSCVADGPEAKLVSTLPRVNLKLHAVSSDLGSFDDVLDCDPAAGTCKLHSISLSQLMPTTKSIDARSVISYVQVIVYNRALGLGMSLAFHLFLLLHSLASAKN